MFDCNGDINLQNFKISIAIDYKYLILPIKINT